MYVCLFLSSCKLSTLKLELNLILTDQLKFCVWSIWKENPLIHYVFKNLGSGTATDFDHWPASVGSTSNPMGQTYAREQNTHTHKNKGREGGGGWVAWESRSGKRKQTRQWKRHGVGWERERGRDEELKQEQEGGRIPGLCAPDEFESMWQCVSLRNVYVNPTHTHQKNRLNPPHSTNFLSSPMTRMNPVTPSALCFNHSV